MLGSSELFGQRKFAKIDDAEVVGFAPDLPKDVAAIRVQESFKAGAPERKTLLPPLLTSLSPFHGGFVKSIVALLTVLILVSGVLIYGSQQLLVRANDLGRQCYDIKPRAAESVGKYRFAMVTCSDGASVIPGRSFEGLMDLVTPNKESYARRHGYKFIDGSGLLDKSRPPSWSKILVVRKHLPDYDWVFWNDADSLVTNPSITLEEIIDSLAGSKENATVPDFIVTEDATGVNAGMFFFRNSNWSMHFLDLWWNQTSFVRPFGQGKSGDNDALKHLIKKMPKTQRLQHVRIPKMQCVFNSYLWTPSMRSGHRLVTLTKTIWQGVYAKGDFMVHLAGLNDKKMLMEKILKDIREEEQTSQKLNTVHTEFHS